MQSGTMCFFKGRDGWKMRVENLNGYASSCGERGCFVTGNVSLESVGGKYRFDVGSNEYTTSSFNGISNR